MTVKRTCKKEKSETNWGIFLDWSSCVKKRLTSTLLPHHLNFPFKMKTELLHSYSSTSLSALSRSPTPVKLNKGLDEGNGGNKPDYTTLEDYSNANSPYYPTEDEGCCKGWMASTFTRKNLNKKLPVISWLPTYNVSKMVSDFIAGLTVGLTLIPQGLAMASVAGLPPQVKK